MQGISKSKRRLGALAMGVVWVFCFLFVLQYILGKLGVGVPGPVLAKGPRLMGIAWLFILERILLWGLLPATIIATLRPRHPEYSVHQFPVLPIVSPVVSIGVSLSMVALTDLLLFRHVPGHSMYGGDFFRFIVFECVGLPLIVVPAALFFRWTLFRLHPRGRLVLHFLYYTILLLWVVPALIFAFTGVPAVIFPEREAWLNRLLLQLIFPAGILGWTAARELNRHGGTPMPWDPPRRLVVTGPYAFVADPLRIAKTALLFSWGLFLGDIRVAAAALLIPLYGITLGRLLEKRKLEQDHGDAWRLYRSEVHSWRPRWHAWRAPDAPPAILYIDKECGACSALGRWFKGSPGLSIACIRTSGAGFSGGFPSRPLYVEGNGEKPDEGIAALARALEHRNLGFAFIGWCIRMPVILPIAQLIYDAVVANPETEAVNP